MRIRIISIMTLPLLISTFEVVLRAVHQPFRTVSVSLSATKWQFILRNDLLRIITGVILGLERAAGNAGYFPQGRIDRVLSRKNYLHISS